ncbi:NADH-ubiquinone oxidoreductase 178 kDa subunit [Aspergillus heteromorphus CBS 117.55]|uniref:NADH-ubiquinone oxidoreductase 178 kDa subunit n=1 Tax=Aspergillus heteromorphus CBS 117.55 TaxID=1448321 RepID=A0A317VER7_9EURO|nr:NADH-ubiquinone oxidoreductase 178 kDa subunit [Aspergillus heteromorphus CBS 117.55]PWY71452.1 NADH-ubiquinone oxidoreductase 178 kDa subunit [Aspergillus heteromorphus CBS 117.55]
MFFARRSVASARLLLRNQQPRRFASSHHAEPVNESFGRSFYVTVGTFASCFVLYRIVKSTEDAGAQSWISSLIEKYTPSQEVFEQRSAIRTAAMEKIAHDRHLFGSQGPRESFDLKQPEVSFNNSPPYNVIPGQSANLNHVIAHYEQKNLEQEQARVARMNAQGGSLYD